MKVTIIHNAFGDEFVKVASYESEQIDEVKTIAESYRLTITIDSPWYENLDLEIPENLRKRGIRSTSVDDFILIENDGGYQNWYKVMAFGFDKVKLSDEVTFVRYPTENERVYETKRLLDLVLGFESLES